jgi:hypothetical protein
MREKGNMLIALGDVELMRILTGVDSPWIFIRRREKQPKNRRGRRDFRNPQRPAAACALERRMKRFQLGAEETLHPLP